jgi:CheY-like chemotaxis protein
MLSIPWRRSGRSVLIVSESPADPLLNSAFLRQPEIRLISTFPDDEGLALVRQERPCLIIEDLEEPDHLGLAFYRELRVDPVTRSIPVILVTPAGLSEETKGGRVDAVLRKPLSRRDLFNAVRRFVPLPRRRGRRLVVNLRFIYEIDGHVSQAFSRDLSPGGAFLKTDRVPPLGTRLSLRFQVPGVWEELHCRAVVRSTSHADPHGGQLSGFGVEFEGLSEGALEQISAFIERHLVRSLLSR